MLCFHSFTKYRLYWKKKYCLALCVMRLDFIRCHLGYVEILGKLTQLIFKKNMPLNRLVFAGIIKLITKRHN